MPRPSRAIVGFSTLLLATGFLGLRSGTASTRPADMAKALSAEPAVRSAAPRLRTTEVSAAIPGCTYGTYHSLTPCDRTVSVLTNSTNKSLTFTLFNYGPATQFTLSCTATAPVGSNCTISAYTTPSIGGGGSYQATVYYSTGASSGTGSVTLKATAWNNQSLATAKTDVTVGPPNYAPLVTPKGGTLTGAAGQQSSVNFTVTNVGNDLATYTFSVTCTGAVQSSCTRSPAQAQLQPGQQQNVAVTATPPVSGTGHISLKATYTGNSAVNDTGWATITVNTPVTVGNDGAVATVTPKTGNAYTFNVTNSTGTPQTVVLTPICTGVAVPRGCSTPKHTLTLGAFTSQTVAVSYEAGATPAATGRVALMAWMPVGADSGWLNVTTSGTVPNLIAATAPHTANKSVERDLCVEVPIAFNASYECGDLRIVHPLTSVRTVNKTRVPVLVYNSNTARPIVLVSADVTLPAGKTQPTSIQAVAKKPNGSNWGTVQSWSGSHWSAGTTRRITLSIDDQTSATTGLHPYELQVTAVYSGGTTSTVTLQDTLAIVNRSASPFGAGWWLAGLERLIDDAASNSKLWIGGDGSTRIYRPAGTDRWAAQAIDYPDTLLLNSGRYYRRLPHGIATVFDAQGRHVATGNRLKDTTYFGYTTTTSETLAAITVPRWPSGPTYSFGYSGSGKLATVTGPGATSTDPRITTVEIPSGRLESITDPESDPVTLGYDTSNPALSGRITSLTAKNQTTASFQYDAALRLKQSSIALGGTNAPIVVNYLAVESRGLTNSGDLTVVDTGTAFTRIDGPRVDTNRVEIWVNRFGAPRRVRNSLGQNVYLWNDDARLPALVTRVLHPSNPSGFLQLAAYDSAGNPRGLVQRNPLDDGRHTIDRAHHDPVWGFADSLITASGVVTTMAYDATYGNRGWQQTGPNQGRRVQFGYAALVSGQSIPYLSSVILPNTAPQEFAYDDRGNVVAVKSPRGFWTLDSLDHAGRSYATVAPIDSLDKNRNPSSTYPRLLVRRWLDKMDRATLTKTVGPAMNGVSQQTLVVWQKFNGAGQLASVARKDSTSTDSLVTRWRYYPTGLVRAEEAPDEEADSLWYDHAGNLVGKQSRRGDVMAMEYDALNRLAKRTVSSHIYAKRDDQGIPEWKPGAGRNPPAYSHNTSYPLYNRNATDGLTTPPDIATFAYDERGAMTRADNASALIGRTYYASGLLKTDTLHIRTLNCATGADCFSQHVYRLEYRYDPAGRPTELRHPSQLTPVISGTVRDRALYSYHPETGALQTVTDILGNVFTYGYSLRGDLTSLGLPRSVSETFVNDDDGGLTAHSVTDPGSCLRQLTRQLDAAGKLLYGESGSVSTCIVEGAHTVGYSGLGHVVESSHWAIGHAESGGAVRHESEETQSLDALGDVLSAWSATKTCAGTSPCGGGADERPRILRYDRFRRQVEEFANGQFRDTTLYDQNGNALFRTQAAVNGAPDVSIYSRLRDQAWYYTGDNKLHAAELRTFSPSGATESAGGFQGVFEEYRYDALGRRVLVWARQMCSTHFPQYQHGQCNLDFVRRTVWDGDKELWEIQKPASTDYGEVTPDNVREDDVGAVALPDYGDFEDDINPYFGRVAYVYGHGVDRPLSVVRINYEDAPNDQPRVWPAFTIVPLWNTEGQADFGYFAETGETHCLNATSACVRIDYPARWELFGVAMTRFYWHGTLIEGKANEAGSFYRRNRYYDPQMGRFTQEDPIGLEGGLNLYGYAAGDPVNYSDPFGLKPCPPDNDCEAPDAAKKLAAAQDEVIADPKFQPKTTPQRITYCNQATCAVARAVGAPMAPLTDAQGNALLANSMAANLAKPGSGYRSVTAAEAQSLANQGKFVIVAGPGHVSTVRPNNVPGQTTPAGHRAPLIANVGSRNGVLGVNYVFQKSQLSQVRYFTPDN
jgi:RHS repeat-associated protein